MKLSTRLMIASTPALLCILACSDDPAAAPSTSMPGATAAPMAKPPQPPASTAPATTPAASKPAMTPAPASASAPATPAMMQPSPTQPPGAAMPPAASAGSGAAAGGAAAPEPMAPAGAKQYTFEEVLELKLDDLVAAWSAAPAEEVWVGCSGKFRELRHGADGTPMSSVPAGWGGKCIPMDTKVLYNIVNDVPTMPGSSMAATGPAELKNSFMDMKPAVITTYPGGYELHFRHMGDKVWVGRQAAGGAISGVWYPLGDITGDGMR